jgi:hypothetical protein
MTNSTTSLEPGWRPDPSGRYEYRYWDGQWTNRVANSSPGGGPAVPPSTGTATAAPSAPATATAPASSTAPPPPASALAVTAALATASGAAPAAPAAVAPFGVADPTAERAKPEAKPDKPRVGVWDRIQSFFRSFVDEEESYKSPLAGPDVEPNQQHTFAMKSPANYGRAGIVALAAGGLATGAYLPWLTGTIDTIQVHRTGFDMGRGVGFWIGAALLALAALLSVQMHKLRWVAMGVAIALTGLVIQDLLDTYDKMQRMNLAPNVAVEIGTGLWIMVGSVAVAMIAGFRLGEDDKIS